MAKKKTIEEYFKRFKINEEWVRDAYLVRELSYPEILKEKGISARIFKLILVEIGIKPRSIAEANSSCKNILKRKNTCLKKYGVSNPSQSEEIKNKKKETFLKNYGVDNIWKSEGYGDYVSETMLTKYGVKRLTSKKSKWGNLSEERKAEIIEKMMEGGKKWRESLTEEEVAEISERLKSSSGSVSKLEKRVSSAIVSLGIPFETQLAIGRFRYDFYFKKLNLILEVNGDYWHASPYKYNYDQIIKFPYGERTAQEVWDKDKIKKDFAESKGFQVYTIWENDLNKMEENCIIEFIQTMILERVFDLETKIP